jgi:hypothetical protein
MWRGYSAFARFFSALTTDCEFRVPPHKLRSLLSQALPRGCHVQELVALLTIAHGAGHGDAFFGVLPVLGSLFHRA